MDALGGMGMHNLGMQAIEGLDLPAGIQSGLMQHFESMEQHQHYHIDPDHLQQHGLVHEPQQHLTYMASAQAAQQEEKQDQGWFTSNFLQVPFPMMQQMQQQQQQQHQQQQHQLVQVPQTAGTSAQQQRRAKPDRRSRNQGAKTRQSYSLEFKLHAIAMFDRLQAISPAANAVNLPKKGGRKMLRDWVKNRHKISEKHHQESNSKNPHELRKIHPGKKPALSEEQERGIHEWYQNERRSGRMVSNKEIAEKAREVANTENFKASSRWMMRFKRKVGLPTQGKNDRKRVRASGVDELGLEQDVDGSDQNHSLFVMHPQHMLSNDVDQLASETSLFIHMQQGMYPQDESTLPYVHTLHGAMMPDYSRQYPATSSVGSLYEPDSSTAVQVSVQDMSHLHHHMQAQAQLQHASQQQLPQQHISPQQLGVLTSYPPNQDGQPQQQQHQQFQQTHPTAQLHADDQHDPSSFEPKTVAV